MNILEYLRQFRLGEYAIFDFTVTFLGMYLLSPWLSKLFIKLGIFIPKKNWLFLTLPISILIHVLVGNITPLTRNFISLDSHYFLKIVIVGLLIPGIYGIKILKKK